MKAKHKLTPGTLAFLDIMSCGLGAVVLVFILMRPELIENYTNKAATEYQLLNNEIAKSNKQLSAITNKLTATEQTITQLKTQQLDYKEKLKAIKTQLQKAKSSNRQQEIASLSAQITKLEQQKNQLAQQKIGSNAMEYVGEGNRQYLTDLVLDGKRTLIILDSSASMLDTNIIDILRRRNSDIVNQLNAPKWQRAKLIVKWLLANLAIDSDYLLSFMTEAVTTTSDELWLPIADEASNRQTLSQLQKKLASGGHSLYKTFDWAMDLKPRPDNIYLITDGLPTIGRKVSAKKIGFF